MSILNSYHYLMIKKDKELLVRKLRVFLDKSKRVFVENNRQTSKWNVCFSAIFD